ncbi:MAG: helix-turn-helix domain-containing protein [Bacteroidales bacterium]|nr:helix-turn-helix domain-containing protein [Bacteroidales bacterium]
MTERLLLILKTKNLTASQFADKINAQPSSISHILSGRNKPSLEFVQKILKKYPEINTDWLLFGKGQMNKISDNNMIESDTKEFLPDRIPGNINKQDIGNSIINEEEENKKNLIDQMIETGEIKNTNTESNKKIKYQKEVEKILVFYKDKTFIEYFPS